MDFKKQYSDLSLSMFENADFRKPPPYEYYRFDMPISEVYLPECDRTFLAALSYASTTEIGLRYLIEAPKGCKMRAAFEYGEMSWRDYWEHKGWLIELRSPLIGPDLSCEYIHPNEVDSYVKDVLIQQGSKGPFQMQIDAYEWRLQNDLKFRYGKFEELKLKYEQLLRNHGPRIFKNMAA